MAHSNVRRGAMCGIAGIFRLTGRPAAVDGAAVLRMMDAQVHRGPDDWGILVPDSLAIDPDFRSLVEARGPDHLRTYSDARAGPGVVLGARRLCVLDVSRRGRMPMASDDGRLWVAHNGEIYNHRELRAELAGPGAPFRSATDTEAILRAYAGWGEGGLARLRGMFAFALFEATPRARLFLARDRLGIKPLYYHSDRERLIFASEVRALRLSGLVPDEASVEALIRFLQWGSVPVPMTTVRDVAALPAGHCLSVDAREPVLRRYWDLASNAWSRSERAAPVSADEAAATTRALLEESTRLHLVSDVPLGIFLSGGMDSSALVALASRVGGAPLNTLSMAFEEPGYGEVSYARLVAERYRTAHHEVVLRGRDLFDGLPRVFAALDEPTVDGVNTFFVSEAAKRAGLTVVLSGTGGDEVFLGYRHFGRAPTLDRLRRVLGAMPARSRRVLVRAARHGGAALGRSGLDRFQYLEEPSLDHLYLLVRGLFSPKQIQDLLDLGPADLVRGPSTAPAPDGSRGDGVLGAFASLEMSHYLQNQLLKDTDVMSMAHSIETRVPFLDHRLVEYVMGLPAAIKLDRDRPKPLLLDALGDALPRAVWDRPKMGFTLPFEPWLRHAASDLEAASASTTLMRPRAVSAVWREYRAGRLHWSRPWALVVLAAFEEQRRARKGAGAGPS